MMAKNSEHDAGPAFLQILSESEVCRMDISTAHQAQIHSAIQTIDTEMSGLRSLRDALSDTELGETFIKAVQALSSCKRRIVVTGMGKSGHVARKIAATLCSVGKASFFLHPGEASHGDLGVLLDGDVVLAISWSGTTFELRDIVNYCNTNQLPLLVMTANPASWIAKAADICLTLPFAPEACPNELAPTTSTTMQMVLGDALAVALIKENGFSAQAFRVFHPGGRLGAQMATLSEIMGTGDAVPRVNMDASLLSATVEMSSKRYGCTAVVNHDGQLVGAFTDGDLRRSITMHDINQPISQHMSSSPLTADPSMLARVALALMNKNAVTVLFVTQNEKLVGIVHMHDLVRLGIE